MPYKSLIILARLLGLGVIVIILVSLLPYAVPYIKDSESFQYIQKALTLEKTISSFVKTKVPTTIAGKDMTRWIILAVAVILGLSFMKATKFCRARIYKLKFKKEYEEWKLKHHLSDGAKVLSPLKEKLDKLETSSKGEREELLRLFAETKKKLDSMGRDLAFLSVDVVDSTGLKQGEDKAVIEYDFKEYKKFVDNKLKEHGAIKSTWTPDGVMTCFATVDGAVKAAREIIDGLDAFNKHVKTIKKDFRVRCGINAGYVYFDESVPLEEMSDHVIDVAGHMQKYATPNSIFISKNIIKPLEETSHFVPISKVVDGYEVYMFERRKAPRE